MKILRILSGDPASKKGGDSFGTVGLEATYPEKIIYIRLAKMHKNHSYYTISKYYGIIKSQIKPHLIILEKNFDYDNVSVAFADIAPLFITTSSHLTNTTRRKLKSVDKPWVINEIRKLHKNHQIQYPHTLSSDMQELINQRHEMAGVTSPSGHTSYKRTRSRHDDMYSAKIIGINHILHWWMELDDE